MKYLQISTAVSYTSIGRIMRQNYDEKKAQGWNCLIAYGRGDDVEGYNTIKIGTQWDSGIQGISTRLFDRHGYGSENATIDFLKKIEEYNPDIIHLHNIHGYYINFELLFAWLKAHEEKKVIWTLHDCWAMTGHCAYFTAVKCGRWKTQCCQCPQKRRYPTALLFSNARNNFERKKRAFTGVKAMTLVVPSHWMEGIVKESFLKEYKIEVVHNKIDTDIFKPTPSNFREKYGLENKKIVLGVANVWEERKGLKDFIKLAEMLDEQYVIVLVGLNRRQMKKLSRKIKGFERITDMEELAADEFVNPSSKETFGMTIAEMQACGTRNVVYGSTACGETADYLTSKESGAESVAIPADVNELYDCITEMLGGMTRTKTVERFICIDKRTDAHELAAIYTMADVFVNPAYEDNYPTVNLEAQACGTLVITYDTGGCRETLKITEM